MKKNLKELYDYRTLIKEENTEEKEIYIKFKRYDNIYYGKLHSKYWNYALNKETYVIKVEKVYYWVSKEEILKITNDYQ